ncbi:MAG: DUF2802 domain-containing protein [Betaproteobacteria bacterium]|nr:DUF2802 domain-containing protein [Betaproteobacteria bacterium]
MTVAVGDLLATTLLVLVVYLGILVFRLARLRPTTPRAAPAPVPAGPDSAAAVPPAVAPAPAPPPRPAPAPAPSATTPRPSTVHEEATALARQGLDAAAIARRCGISLGEAELVCWLANNKEPR